MAARKTTQEFIAANAFELLGDNDAGDDVIARMASMKVEKAADVCKPSKTEKKKSEAAKAPVQQNKTNSTQNTTNLRVTNPYFPQNQRRPYYNNNNNNRPFFPNNYNNRPFYPNNYNNRSFYPNNNTQSTNNVNSVNNVKNQAQTGQQQWTHYNGGNRRYQNTAPYRAHGTNFVRSNEVSVATDETGSVKSVKSVKSEREQEEIERQLEAEQKFKEFKYDSKEEKVKRDELWKLNKLIDANGEDLEKIKGFYYKEREAGEISETTNNLWKKVREEKAALLQKKSEIREYLNMAEQKKMTLADYEKIKEEKKKALKPSQNVRAEAQDFSGLVVVSKKGNDDSAPKHLSKPKVESVRTEKPKKIFVPLKMVRIGGEAQNQSQGRNRNGQNGAVNPPILDSNDFPTLA